MAPSLCPVCLPFLPAQGYPRHKAGADTPKMLQPVPFHGDSTLALPGPKSHEVVPKITGSGMMGGSRPCCQHVVLLPGRVFERRQVRRHGNCHGEMQQGNNALDPSRVPHRAPVSWHSRAGSCWGKAELDTHGVSAQPPGTLQSPVGTVQTLWVPYRATWSPCTP